MKRLLLLSLVLVYLLAQAPATATVGSVRNPNPGAAAPVAPPEGVAATSLWFPPPVHFVAPLATLEIREGQGFFFEEDVEKNPPGCWRLADTDASRAEGFGGKNRVIWCHRGYPVDQGTLRIGETLGIFTDQGPTQEGVNFFVATIVSKVIIGRDDEEAVTRETWRPALTLISCEGEGDDPPQRLVIRAVFELRKRGGEMVFPKMAWGDSLENLARRFSADAEEIRRLNAIGDEGLQVGKLLAVPLPTPSGSGLGVISVRR